MRSLRPYILAVVSTAAATAATALLWPANRSVVVALYYLVVSATAIYGNRRATVLAFALSALSTSYFFFPPYDAFSLTSEGVYLLVIFTVVSSVLVGLTERLKTNERKLRVSEELFGRVFRSNPSALAISRVSDGRYVEMNAAFCALVACSREESMGSTASQLGLVSAGQREEYVAEIREKGALRERLFVFTNRAGATRQTLLTSEPVDYQGQPHFLAVFNDITERKQAEEALRRSEVQFRQVMDGLPVGAYTCDAEGRITYFNDAAARLWGRAPRLNDLTDRFCGSFRLLAADGTQIPPGECWMALALQTGTSYDGQAITIERPDGTRVNVLVHVHPLPDVSGGQAGTINVLVDVTDRKLAEDALHEQAMLVANAQRIGRMGSWSLDLRTGRLDWSDATCDLFGITPAEFEGTLTQFHSFILPEDVLAYDDASARVSVSEPLFEAEYRIRRPDGQVRWMHSRGQVDLDPKGNPIGRSGMVMDITEQRIEREQLIENAALLRTAGRVAHLGGWTLQLPDRTLTWSDENCVIHDVSPGYKPTLEEGLGLYLPEHRADVIRHLEVCEREGTPYDFELPKLTVTGRRIWVRSIGEAVRDAEGKITRLQGAFQDITDRRHADERLRESEAQFRTLAEAMPQMVWMTRPDGWNIYFNQRWVDYTGLSLEDSYGHGWNTPFHPDDRQRAWDAWQQAIAGGDYNVECRLRGADGSYRWMLVRGLPFRDQDGRIMKWIGTCTDIDDLKQAQEANSRQAHMLDQIGQAVIATDAGGRVIYANRFAGELYGWAPGEMLGRAITEVTVPQATLNQGHEIMGSCSVGKRGVENSWSRAAKAGCSRRTSRIHPSWTDGDT